MLVGVDWDPDTVVLTAGGRDYTYAQLRDLGAALDELVNEGFPDRLRACYPSGIKADVINLWGDGSEQLDGYPGVLVTPPTGRETACRS